MTIMFILIVVFILVATQVLGILGRGFIFEDSGDNKSLMTNLLLNFLMGGLLLLLWVLTKAPL